MQCTISKDKLLVALEWVLFIALCIVSCWFASGVMEQYLSSKTSFSQRNEGYITMHPAIVFKFYLKSSEINSSNVKIVYKSSGSLDTEQILKIGKNYIPNRRFNKTEVVLLESLVSGRLYIAFRITSLTPIIKNKKGIGGAVITVGHYFMNNNKSSWKNDNIRLCFTSIKNSPGFTPNFWKDGKPLHFVISKNTRTRISIQPEEYLFLEKNGKCQQESYYECIISRFDTGEFKECPKKCIPLAFANIHKNYTTPLCQNDTINEKCALKIIGKLVINNGQNIDSFCKRSCFTLQYSGEVVNTRPYDNKDYSNVNYYSVRYMFDTDMFNVYEEYLIYDTISMIGSVGGTLGMFIGFSMTGVISWIFVYFKGVHFSNFIKT